MFLEITAMQRVAKGPKVIWRTMQTEDRFSERISVRA